MNDSYEDGRARNVHHVPGHRWVRWTETARRLFNSVFTEMADQTYYAAPGAERVSKLAWKNIRFRAAINAAEMAMVASSVEKVDA